MTDILPKRTGPALLVPLQRGTHRFKSWLARAWRTVKPVPQTWKGAALALLTAALLLWVLQVANFTVPASPLVLTPLMFVSGVLVIALAAYLLSVLIAALARLPGLFRWALAVALFSAGNYGLMTGSDAGMAVVIAAVVVVGTLIGAGAGTLAGGWRRLAPARRVVALASLVIGLVALAFGVFWLLNEGFMAESAPNAAALSPSAPPPLDLPDPSLPGDYDVLTLTYGSGEDRHREAYGAGADLITEPVDGSAFVKGWEGLGGDARTAYWGFDSEALPLNARVWYPDGDGPFPLVLVVHGNHLAEDFSDEGYDYLGELLASRGMIVASVDENFLNSTWDSIIGGLKEENDARGWLLLEHLRQWRAWNSDPASPFAGRVDMENIALIGHSRGGEAVAIAAAFNRLPAYPDDAAVAFDYGFNIRAVVGIAPVDGQYRPAGVGTPLRDVNYLVLHGSYDGDVQTLSAASQYDRVEFSEGFDGFKALFYIDRANHGQFNTTWGRRSDAGTGGSVFYNLRPILTAEEQRQAASVAISAFLEATLRGERGYRALFRDARVASGWLPETIYIQQYAESSTRYVSTFDEDIDVRTATLEGAMLAGEGLSTWHEQRVAMKWGMRETKAVYLGWQEGDRARYTIAVPGGALDTSADSALVFSLADAGMEDDDAPQEPIDLTVALVDEAGKRAELPISHVMLLQPMIKPQVKKLPLFVEGPGSEPLFQTYRFPLADFAAANEDFDPERIAEIRFVFDRTPQGRVILDDVGFDGMRLPGQEG